LGKDYQRELDELIYVGIGRIVWMTSLQPWARLCMVLC
jgi:hypothetical protein